MDTRIDPIADRTYRISTFVPEGPPGGITFNQFLLVADEPLLFHTGTRRLFPAAKRAVGTVVDPAAIRWISSTHASRPDEYGALDLWLDTAPRAQAAHGRVGCFVCLDDMACRPPWVLADGDVLDLGGRRVQWFDTPHVPGPWEAGVLFDLTTRTLFCGDLFARAGSCEVVTSHDIVEAAITHDQLMHGNALTPQTASTLRQLARLQPQRLALMHGPTYAGDGAGALEALARYFEAALTAELAVLEHSPMQ